MNDEPTQALLARAVAVLTDLADLTMYQRHDVLKIALSVAMNDLERAARAFQLRQMQAADAARRLSAATEANS